MAKRAVQKPRIKIMAADWSLRDYPSARNPWSIQTKVRRVKEAGFHGMSSGADAELSAELHKNRLEMVGGVDVGRKKEADAKMKAFADIGVVHINVQLCDHDTRTKDAVKIARAVVKAGKKYKVTPAIEIHRDTCTETPEKAYALVDAYEKKYKKKLRMNFDHSHPAIIKQLRPHEYWERLSERTDLLQMHELIHFRPFTGSHCQTPVTNGKGRLDRDFKVWLTNYLEPALDAWLQGAKSGKTLYVVPELGPQGSGYALACFPDIWQDAIREKNEIVKVWRRLMRNWNK